MSKGYDASLGRATIVVHVALLVLVDRSRGFYVCFQHIISPYAIMDISLPRIHIHIYIYITLKYTLQCTIIVFLHNGVNTSVLNILDLA